MKQQINIFFIFLFALAIMSCSTNSKLTKSSQFSVSQSVMINNADGETPMRVFKITSESDSILLRTKSQYVKPDSNDKELQLFVDRLYSTVRDSMSLGVGIAAPQVGILKNIIWVQRFDKEGFPFEVYLNPVITKYSEKKQTCREGCLSIPNRTDTLNSRAYSIVIEYDKMDESHHEETVEEFTAVIFQHEIDHLNGIIYLDHLALEIKEAEATK